MNTTPHTLALAIALGLFAPLALANNIIKVSAPIAQASAESGVDQPESPSEVTFNSNVLPNGTQGDSYSADLNALISNAPGDTSLKWSTDDAPAGLDLSLAGLLSGEPMSIGQNSFVVSVTDGKTLKSETLNLYVASNTGTYTMVAGTQTGQAGGVTLTAVGSYKTELYNVSMGNIIRDDNGNRVMAYMHKSGTGTCFASIVNVNGDGYSTSGSPTAANKAWITAHPILKFNTSSGVYATYSNGSVQSYYNGWYRQYSINCSVFQTWQSNPGLITSVTFQ